MLSVVMRISDLGGGRVTGGKGIALVMKAKANVKQKYFGHNKNMESLNEKNPKLVLHKYILELFFI